MFCCLTASTARALLCMADADLEYTPAVIDKVCWCLGMSERMRLTSQWQTGFREKME